MCPGAVGARPGSFGVREEGRCRVFFFLCFPKGIVSRCCLRKVLYVELETVINVVRKRLLKTTSSFVKFALDVGDMGSVPDSAETSFVKYFLFDCKRTVGGLI
jgi:hypothetical protein